MDKKREDFRQPEQLAKTESGFIKPAQLEEEMKKAYLDYAMSVIVARALPDLRDGLKPVHRRILYAMKELGLTAQAKFRKSATIVGEVLGKYHPHGDIAVYDALVRMAQDFAMRYPLIHGQGNFGSVDGDSAGAMRYTEAKMTPIAEELLADIEKETVAFMDNYDGTTKEPVVLPARLPNLLLNGTMGIAVGMATNIPPHNLSELVDALVYLIEHPEASTDDLFRFIKGPDFPTGGIIYNLKEIKEAYATGKGRIVTRGVAEVVIGDKKEKTQIIISEIPYGVNKADLVSHIAELIKTRRIEGVSDLRDESDKEGVRIVLDLKKDAFPQKILNSLFKYTSLQQTFHLNMLALVDGLVPKVLTLKMALEEWLKHRRVVVTKRCEYELKLAKARAHLLEGLKKALEHLDQVIEIIKQSETREKASQNLVKKLNLDETQANAILEMRLSALSALERRKINQELQEKQKTIARLTGILADPQQILRLIKGELEEAKKRYGDARRTKIKDEEVAQLTDVDLIPNEEMVVTLTASNYIKRTPVGLYRSQVRGGKGVRGVEVMEEDKVENLVTAFTLDRLLFFTNLGRVFQLKTYDIPAASRNAKGIALVNLIGLSPEERVTSLVVLKESEKSQDSLYLFMATKKGIVKKTAYSEYRNVRRNGLIAIRLSADDELTWVKATTGDDEIILTTKNGFSIRFNEKDVRVMSRPTRGVVGIRLKRNDQLVGMDVVKKEGELFTVTENGLGKRTPIRLFRLQNRGGYGIIAQKINEKTGFLVTACVVDRKEVKDLIIVSQGGQVIRIPYRKISLLGRTAQGVRLIRLLPSDRVASVTHTSHEANFQEMEGSNKND